MGMSLLRHEHELVVDVVIIAKLPSVMSIAYILDA